IWSPTFLLSLLDSLVEQGSRLVRDIADGAVSVRLPAGTNWAMVLRRPDRQRAAVLERALDNGRLDTRHLWPSLDTISCWTDGSARCFVPSLQAAFAHGWVQGKGLLATEGAVSVPLNAWPYPVLAVNSAFYEFFDGQENARLPHELHQDSVYRVIMTTHGGLYRYDSGDLVRMRGWARSAPMLEFIGRAGLVSDLCGEKLSEGFVAERLPATVGFAMLAPAPQPHRYYILFLDGEEVDQNTARALAGKLEEALCANPQYDYARRLGQLGRVNTCRVQQPMSTFARFVNANGQRVGDIKPPTLRTEREWQSRFVMVDSESGTGAGLIA
ncbi:MAG: GH3 auxin-responsive promoter family protein, partial [Gammaproteobacteria bacterium]|nr:GH3 auxin-responsive promoter family protein [Gammaproteobacteria bacterium]